MNREECLEFLTKLVKDIEQLQSRMVIAKMWINEENPMDDYAKAYNRLTEAIIHLEIYKNQLKEE